MIIPWSCALYSRSFSLPIILICQSLHRYQVLSVKIGDTIRLYKGMSRLCDHNYNNSLSFQLTPQLYLVDNIITQL